MRQLLDTNVISELLRSRIDPVFGLWAERQNRVDQALSVITLAELRYGADLLPPGRRRDALGSAIDTVLPSEFGERLLSVGPEVADVFGRLLAFSQRTGLNGGDRDLLLAATSVVHGLTVVTRNVGHFEPLGVAVLNPWEPAAP